MSACGCVPASFIHKNGGSLQAIVYQPLSYRNKVGFFGKFPISSVTSKSILISRSFERPWRGSMHETGCSGLVHWDDPEGWVGEGGGRVFQDGEHVYTHG